MDRRPRDDGRGNKKILEDPLNCFRCEMLLKEGSVRIGSAQEAIVSRYWQMQKHASVIAMMLPIIASSDPDKFSDLYMEYTNLYMPYAAGSREPSEDNVKKLKKWVSGGPIKIAIPVEESLRGVPKAWRQHYMQRLKDGGGTT